MLTKSLSCLISLSNKRLSSFSWINNFGCFFATIHAGALKALFGFLTRSFVINFWVYSIAMSFNLWDKGNWFTYTEKKFYIQKNFTWIKQTASFNRFKGIFVWIKEIISFKITKYNFNTSKYYVVIQAKLFFFIQKNGISQQQYVYWKELKDFSFQKIFT